MTARFLQQSILLVVLVITLLCPPQLLAQNNNRVGVYFSGGLIKLYEPSHYKIGNVITAGVRIPFSHLSEARVGVIYDKLPPKSAPDREKNVLAFTVQIKSSLMHTNGLIAYCLLGFGLARTSLWHRYWDRVTTHPLLSFSAGVEIMPKAVIAPYVEGMLAIMVDQGYPCGYIPVRFGVRILLPPPRLPEYREYHYF